MDQVDVELLVQGKHFVQETHFFQNNTDNLQFSRLSLIEYLFTVLSGIDWRSPVAFDQKPPVTSRVLLTRRGFQLVTSASQLIQGFLLSVFFPLSELYSS